MIRNTFLLAFLLVIWCPSFSQKKNDLSYMTKYTINNLLVQHCDTSFWGYLIVDNHNHFYCYPFSADYFMTCVDSSFIVTLGNYEDCTYEDFPNYRIVYVNRNHKPQKEDKKIVMYHKDTVRIDTIWNLLGNNIPKLVDFETDTIMYKSRYIENAYLQSKFGYGKDSAIARFIVPEFLFEDEHNGFYDLKLYKQPNGKIRMVSSYGCVEYPQGFVVKDTKTYNQLGYQGYRRVRMRYVKQNIVYKHSSFSCDKIANYMIDEFKPTNDSIWIKSLYPCYIEIAGHRYLISNDALQKDNSNLDILMLCEYIRYLNHSKRQSCKWIKKPYN